MTLDLDLEVELGLSVTAGVAAVCPVAKSACPETVLHAQSDQKSLCAPDDYNTIVTCTDIFYHPV